MYRTYDEERRQELIDKSLQAMGELVLLMLKARTEEQLAERIVPISTSLLNGHIHMIDCAVPRIEDLRYKIDEVHELLEKFEVELKTVNDRIREQATEDARQANVSNRTEVDTYMTWLANQLMGKKS
jgi:hypothetical protein